MELYATGLGLVSVVCNGSMVWCCCTARVVLCTLGDGLVRMLDEEYPRLLLRLGNINHNWEPLVVLLFGFELKWLLLD